MSYSAEVLSDSPVLYLRMDEAAYPAQDSSGNNNDVNAEAGDPTYQIEGAVVSDASGNYGVLFAAASSERWTVADHATLDLGNGPLTLECWIKRTSGTGAFQCMIGKGANAYGMRLSDSHNLEFFQVGVAVIVASTTTITDTTTWHHCVSTKSGTTTKLYIDGSDVTGTVTDQTLSDTSIDLDIASSAGGQLCDMSMDEVAVYNSALDATRILAHYNAAIGQVLLPDSDIAAGGWSAFGTASLWAATSDSSDSTYMLGTAS